MLSKVVLIQKRLLHGRETGREQHGMKIHECHFLQHHRVVHRIQGIRAPGKGAVAVHQNRRHLRRVHSPFPERLHNHPASFPLIPGPAISWDVMVLVQGISP